MQTQFYSHGKLLITGEYTILKGSTGLAVPTKMGQKMWVKPSLTENQSLLEWKAFDFENNIWFTCTLSYKSWAVLSTNNTKFSKTLIQVLKEANGVSGFFEKKIANYLVETHLEFPNYWGLGSSSTFINNIAKWLQVDPFTLLFNTLGGSGYDIACANHSKPIYYSLEAKNAVVSNANFFPTFHNNLFFIYLNQKKETSTSLSNFLANNTTTLQQIARITQITNLISSTKVLDEFSNLITEHENILSTILGEKTIKELLFKEYPHAIKSLGAWGGDFILVVANNTQDLTYFKTKKYTTIFSYQEMILS